MAGSTPQVKRTREIEEVTNLYFIHPISRGFVTVFARLGVHPNLVSCVGILFGAMAALAYFQYQRWEMALAGFLFMLGWHVMDGADGQLARLTGKTSELGKVLDGLVDHLCFAMVYISLTIASSNVFGPWVWWLAVAAGVSHVVQASTYEFQRQSYDYWVFGKESARPQMPSEFREGRQSAGGLGRIFDGVLFLYLSLQHRVAGVNSDLIAQLSAMNDMGQGEQAAEAYRSANLRGVKTWSVLCSNYRTIGIFVACLAKNPLYFFLFEVGALNASLLLLRMMQARNNRSLLAQLSSLESLSSPGARAAA